MKVGLDACLFRTKARLKGASPCEGHYLRLLQLAVRKITVVQF